jgi:tetratricopeptide (TPR) repeat protein
MKLIIPLCLIAGPAIAQDCPPAPDHAEAHAAIISQLNRAADAEMAAGLGAELWDLWLDAPDDRAQDLLDEGMALRNRGDLDGSVTVLDALVAYCPDYAEGFNQRAFSHFLAQDYEASLTDLDRALALNGTHVAALSGKGLTLIGLGREEEAQEALRAAVRLNPWLRERALIDGPPETTL